MGYLGGFVVTLRADRASSSRSPRQYAEGRGRQARQAGAPPRPPRPQPVRGRHGEVHRLRAVRRRVPGPLHLRARRRQPARRPGLARRALRLRLRDQLPALHPLRPVRRGLPDRGHHRDEAVRVLLHQPRRRHLHQGRAAGRRRRPARSSCRGRTGRRRRGRRRTPSAWVRATAPSGDAAYEGRVGWSGELGFGVQAARAGPGRRPTGDATEPDDRHRRPARRPRAATDGGRRLRRLRRHRAGRRPRRRPVAQPGPLRPHAGGDAVRRSPCCSSRRTPTSSPPCR